MAGLYRGHENADSPRLRAINIFICYKNGTPVCNIYLIFKETGNITSIASGRFEDADRGEIL